MSFTDHKIAQFVHRVVDLPDQPNLPSDELKARFDSSPEELRIAHNALCDDADRLDDRVSGIIAETFGDTISKSMLSDELQEELNAKATKAELDEDTAALDARLDTVETALPQKVECYFGTYTGNDVLPRTIELGFKPKAVLVVHQSGRTGHMVNGYSYYYGGLALDTQNCTGFAVTDNGFQILAISGNVQTNTSGSKYLYIAFH